VETPLENVVRLMQQPVQADDDRVLFTDFWALYPKRIARKDAERAWDKIDASEHAALLLALVAWRRVWRQRDDDQYIPYPASWLRGERWTDELPAEYTRSHASHVPAKLPEAERRGEMPEAVRALLAKIRAKP
jgi:hypothetical protein